LVFELRDVGNRWAHNEGFSTQDAHWAVESVGRLLAAVSARMPPAVLATQSAEVEQLRNDLICALVEEGQCSGKITLGKVEQQKNEIEELKAEVARLPGTGTPVTTKPGDRLLYS
jgi:hypothetical protein